MKSLRELLAERGINITRRTSDLVEVERSGQTAVGMFAQAESDEDLAKDLDARLNRQRVLRRNKGLT